MFDEIFARKKLVLEKLTAYGFENKGDYYQYITEIKNGEFMLTVQIDKNGMVDTNLREKESGELYVLYKTNATGAYIGEIRTAIEQALRDVVKNCYMEEIFKTTQAQMAIQFVKETYGDELEFLWEKSPDNAIWRRKDNEKWYGIIMTVMGNKIGLDTDKVVEIIDLRMDSSEAEEILSRQHYYPGWHMNKKSWYTIVLDGGISDEELKAGIEESYRLAMGKKSRTKKTGL
ncbi:MAG: MmcQ/YjbR family DNA-binding protein [Bacillus sp. (in: Bacteria)]|nr:MmcQ/YjbR family DNA-binding protein [Bacillus sp. (in: firmicutes)]MCM1427266.1 MmcQ/YjbR family DNA-binding protein [Eubacterium sp.]